jgi:RimJ/RimL family protein N-acetyltransferase
MNVRVLQADDAAAFQVLRLRALREHPESFGSSYEEEEGRDLDEIARSFTAKGSSMFGAYDGTQLIGMTSLNRSQRAKTCHRAMLGAMYVAPEARGQGVGRALIDAALSQARTIDGLEDVVLAVTVGNEAARHLYAQAGFTAYSIDPRFIRVDGRSYDIEWMILRIRHDG